MDQQDNQDPPAEPDRFASAIELGPDVPGDPGQILQKALADGNDQQAMGAFRMLQAGGKKPDLEPGLALKLADLLEDHEMYVDAARVCRRAAERDMEGSEAAPAILRAARLLLGPAKKRMAGTAMLGYLVERYPDHRLQPEALELMGRIERGEPTGLEPDSGEADVKPPIHGNRLAIAIQQKIGRVGSPRWRTLSIGFKAALLICALTYGLTWYLRDRHQSVDDIDPAVLGAPVQTPVKDTGLIEFTRDGYAYELNPRFDYSIAGLIVSLRDYTFMSVRSTDSVFPMDVCMIWGSNVDRRAHQSPDIEFEQHGRFCVYTYKGQNQIRNAELSNSHLLLASPDLEDTLGRLRGGDQVRIRGQLVNVKARRIVKRTFADLKYYNLNTSISREDSGGGACEVIYVRELEILKAAHPVAWALSSISSWVFWAMLLVVILRLVLFPMRIRETI